MGGGKGNRVAGNVKPTSSGRIVDLLGEGHPAIITFSALSSSGVTVGDVAFNDSDDFQDTELRLIWKRLGKKDIVTRIKAMKDLSNYLDKSKLIGTNSNNEQQTASYDSLVPILPHWCKQFSRHGVDNDHQLRYATFEVHEKFALRLRRNFAPYLKQLMPIWIVGQFDPSATVSRCARRSFDSIFPRKDKQIEAIHFCQRDIIDYSRTMIFDGPDNRIFALTQASFIELHERLIASCLGSIGAIVHTANGNKLSKLIEKESSFVLFLNNEKFWKLSRHQSQSVKLAFYRLLVLVVEKFNSNFSKFLTEFSLMKMYQCSLGKLYDKSPSITGEILKILVHLYPSATHAQKIDCDNVSPWTMINFSSTFQPLLFSLLRRNKRDFNDVNEQLLYKFLIKFLHNHNFQDINIDSIDDCQFITQFTLSSIEGIPCSSTVSKYTSRQNDSEKKTENLPIVLIIECLTYTAYKHTFRAREQGEFDSPSYCLNKYLKSVSPFLSEKIEFLVQQGQEAQSSLDDLLKSLVNLLIVLSSSSIAQQNQNLLLLEDEILSIIQRLVDRVTDPVITHYSDSSKSEITDERNYFLRVMESLSKAFESTKVCSITDLSKHNSTITVSPTLAELVEKDDELTDIKLLQFSNKIKMNFFVHGAFARAADKIISYCTTLNPTPSALNDLVEMLKIDVESCLGSSESQLVDRRAHLWSLIKKHYSNEHNELLLKPLVAIIIELTRQILSHDTNHDHARAEQDKRVYEMCSNIVEESTQLFTDTLLFYELILSYDICSPDLKVWTHWLRDERFKAKMIEVASSVYHLHLQDGNVDNGQGDLESKLNYIQVYETSESFPESDVLDPDKSVEKSVVETPDNENQPETIECDITGETYIDIDEGIIAPNLEICESNLSISAWEENDDSRLEQNCTAVIETESTIELTGHQSNTELEIKWRILENLFKLVQNHNNSLTELFCEILNIWRTNLKLNSREPKATQTLSHFSAMFSAHILHEPNLYNQFRRPETLSFICDFYEASTKKDLYSEELNQMTQKCLIYGNRFAKKGGHEMLVCKSILNQLRDNLLNLLRDSSNTSHFVNRVISIISTFFNDQNSDQCINYVCEHFLPHKQVWLQEISVLTKQLMRQSFYKKMFCLPQLLVHEGSKEIISEINTNFSDEKLSQMHNQFSCDKDEKECEKVEFQQFMHQMNQLCLITRASCEVIAVANNQSVALPSSDCDILAWILTVKSILQFAASMDLYPPDYENTIAQINALLTRSKLEFELDHNQKSLLYDQLYSFVQLYGAFPYSLGLRELMELTQMTPDDLFNCESCQVVQKIETQVISSLVAYEGMRDCVVDTSRFDMNSNQELNSVVLLEFCGNYCLKDSKLITLLKSLCDQVLASSETHINCDYKTACLVNSITSCIRHMRNKSEIFELIYPVLSMINDLRSSQNDINKKLEDLNHEEIALSSALIDLYRALIEHLSTELSLIEWDLILVSITKWIGMLLDAKDRLLHGIFLPIFSTRVLDLVYDLTNLAKQWQTLLDKGDSSETFPLMDKLIEEWTDFHSSNVYFALILIYFDLTNRKKLTERDLIPIASISKIVINVKPEIIWDNSMLLPEMTDDQFQLDEYGRMKKTCKFCKLPKERQNGFNNLCNMLTSNYRSIIVSASHILSSLMPTVCAEVMKQPLRDEANNQNLATESDSHDLEITPVTPPVALMSLLKRKDSMVSTFLSDFRVGHTSVVIETGTYSYTCTISYFLVWHHILQFMTDVSMDIAQQTSAYLQETGFIQRLLDNIYRLMPSLNDCHAMFNSQAELTKFLRSPIAIEFDLHVNEIELLALHTYFEASLRMPVTVRMWWNNLNKRVYDLVNKYTTQFISPVICALELEIVQEQRNELMADDRFKNMTVKARQTAREVVAQYSLDEFNLELTIKMPENYPLGPVQVDGGKRVGVSDTLWRNWLLRLTTFLNHQNGQILDGIELWKRNVDKRFDGIEECMICFSILHSNQQLPRLKCRHCSKLFHSSCVYRWFVTSRNSTCPLCRNLW